MVVKSPDPRLFEQAIFIVRDDAFIEGGLNPDKILLEACRVVDDYMRQNKTKKAKKTISAPLLFFGAALAGTIILLITMIVGG